MRKDKPILKRQTGGDIPVKFNRPLKLEEIPTQNKIHVINNYSPKYDYIVEGDKIYYALKGRNYWVDISDNNIARTNLYNFLGNNYNFRGYEDDEKSIWNLIKQGTFNYKQYRELKNKPKDIQPVKLDSILQTPTKQQEQLVTVRVGTSGGGFTNIKVPEYMAFKKLMGIYEVKPEYQSQAYQLAKKQQPERYADPINNTGNWLPFVILTGGRGLENMGYRFISPLVEKIALKASGIEESIASSTGRLASNVSSRVAPVLSNLTKGASNFLSKVPQTVSNLVYYTPTRQALTKATIGATMVPVIAQYLKIDNPGSSEVKLGWNMLMDRDFSNLSKAAIDYIDRLKDKKFGGDDTVTSLNLPLVVDNQDSNYALRPQSVVTGDTIKVPKNNRRYIIPEVLDVNALTFKHRNRGDYSEIESEAAPITTFFPFIPYEDRDRYKHSKTFIGYNSKTGQLKAGDISQFGPGDYLTASYANDFTEFAKDNNGKILYKNDAEHNNGSRSVPVMITTEGRKGSLSILTDLDKRGDLKGKVYGNVAGGRTLVRVGDEFRLISGSIEDINTLFEEMKKRNHATYGTFYTLDNGSYNRGLRTYDKRFTVSDLKNYDDLHRGGGGNFLYITLNPTFRSDTILTPKVRTELDDSYKKGHSLTNEKEGIVLHHAGKYPSLEAIVLDLTTPVGLPIPWRVAAGYIKPEDILSKANSSHVIIGYDGTRKVLATPDKVTFHAGASVHNNRQNVNDFMIGIEFEGDTNNKDLTPELIASAIEYLEPIIRENNIRLEDIVTHLNVRDLYNDYARKTGLQEAASKPDINKRNYNLILLALLKKIYYKK